MVTQVMIMAGGTGGHVFPALAVACWLRDQGHRIHWLGTAKGLESKLVPKAGFELEQFQVSGLRGKGWRQLLAAPWMLFRALLQARAILRSNRPDVVLGMGGFVAGPGGIMALWLGIPLVIHEQNRIPGTTNRLLAAKANRVLEAFPDTFADTYRPCWTGNPLRSEIESLGAIGRQFELPLRILVVGGSQGARILNDMVPAALRPLKDAIEVRHQCGPLQQAQVDQSYRQAGLQAQVEPFIESMAEAYSWADLAICRAGAMTVSELAAAGLPAILVPYPHAIGDHQTHNADYLVQQGAAVMLPQSKMTVSNLQQLIAGLIAKPAKLQEMSDSARRAARLDATETVARICLEEARNGTKIQQS